MQAYRRAARRTASISALALVAALASGAALAQVDVSNAWVRGTVPTQTASGAFMTLHAHSPGKLLGVSSPVGTAEIHEMKMENNVMRMRPVQSVDLPAMQNVDLKPGGYHVMLLDLKSQLKPGDKVPLVLKIEQGGKVTEQRVTAEVRSLTAPAGAAPAPADHKH
ncbi:MULTISPECIES: copper chaperone PCu(A)C [unclassified Cupriavidus]|uniref:copper chaperone PCu(A)C n=1 Tax=Cupriavidus sp. H19C3 TaxID=3241603 RepID=UPI003BF7D09D